MARQRLRPDDYIWHPTWETWRAAGEVPGLFWSSAPAQHIPLNTSKGSGKESLKDRARHELRSYIIISAYIWAIISLLRLHAELIAETYQLSLQTQGRAFVMALILGKVVLIAEALRLGSYLGNRFPALSVLIRSVLFASAILCFHAAEELTFALWEGRSAASIVDGVSTETIRRGVLLALIMSIALVPYFLIKEIEKRTGQSDLLLVALGMKR